MLRSIIETADGLVHAARRDRRIRSDGLPREGIFTPCGYYLQDLVANNLGHFVSRWDQELRGVKDTFITCFECINAGAGE